MNEIPNEASAIKVIKRICDLHIPFTLYTECEHEHEVEGNGVALVDDIGLTCNKLYDVCYECCTDRGSQYYHCMETHGHKLDAPICPTIAAIMEASDG